MKGVGPASILVRVMFAAFVFLCTVEAVYWPVIMIPGTRLEWWQVKWLAQLGCVLGFGPILLCRWVGGWVLLLVAMIWTLVVFFVTGMFKKK